MADAFADIPKIKYEGPKSKNPLAFKHYNPEEIVEGKMMREHLRFSAAYGHTAWAFTAARPWDDASNSVKNAQHRVRAAFEFIHKVGAPFYAFNDREVAPEGSTLAETNRNLDAVVKVLKEEQKRTGIKLLWGTACLFVHPRYMHGAATSCNADIFAYAGAQVKKALEMTKELEGGGFTFCGGREWHWGFPDTDLKREMDHLAAFLHMAVDYKKKIGFKGAFYIEPKLKEPTEHQFDSNAAACLNFLRQYDLMEHFRLNVGMNHAMFVTHTMQHEIEVAAAAGALGSIDASMGDILLGWDTDQFPADLYLTTQVMLTILKMGGFKTGGTNFDAKVRRESFEPVDLFYTHIAGMDAFARGLKAAAAIRKGGQFEEFIKQRYSSWDSGIGQKVEQRKVGFAALEKYILEVEPPEPRGAAKNRGETSSPNISKTNKTEDRMSDQKDLKCEEHPAQSATEATKSTARDRRRFKRSPFQILRILHALAGSRHAPMLFAAMGDVFEKTIRGATFGLSLIFLILGGLIITAFKPDNAKDLWLIIGPLISGAFCFLAGKYERGKETGGAKIDQ